MFQFRRFPSHTYFIQYGIPCGGFPHSEISGSLLICSSPKLIAAYHVLHRLLMPRHSPCALFSLIIVEVMNLTPFLPLALRARQKLRQLHPFSSSNQNPLTLGFWFVKRTAFTDQRPHYFFKSHYIRKVQLVLYYSWIMQAHVLEDFSFSKNCNFYPLQIFTQNLWKMFLTVAFS